MNGSKNISRICYELLRTSKYCANCKKASNYVNGAKNVEDFLPSVKNEKSQQSWFVLRNSRIKKKIVQYKVERIKEDEEDNNGKMTVKIKQHMKRWGNTKWRIKRWWINSDQMNLKMRSWSRRWLDEAEHERLKQ